MPLDFPSSPTNGQVYGNYYYDSSIGAWRNVGSKDGLSQRLTAVETTGYRYNGSLYYTGSGTFTKANYPWLRAIKVRLVGGGGGSGSCGSQDGSNLFSSAGGGGGGGYAEKFITDIGSVASSVTVTIGGGGGGGASAGATGGDGGTTSFGSISATGGTGGQGTSSNNTVPVARYGGAGGVGSGGDINIEGGAGGTGVALAGYGTSGGNGIVGGNGGASLLSGSTRGVNSIGNPGKNYGGGASGPANTYAPLRNGDSGAAGIVIVELYA